MNLIKINALQQIVESILHLKLKNDKNLQNKALGQLDDLVFFLQKKFQSDSIEKSTEASIENKNVQKKDSNDIVQKEITEPQIEIEGTEEIYGGDCGIPEFITFDNLNGDYRKMMTCTNQAKVEK